MVLQGEHRNISVHVVSSYEGGRLDPSRRNILTCTASAEVRPKSYKVVSSSPVWLIQASGK